MSEPTAMRGYVDDSAVLTLDGYSTGVDYLLEHIPALVHPESVRVFSQMRTDPMIAGILKAYAGPINRAHWSIDPAGCRDEVVEKIADDLGLPIKGWSDEPNEDEPDAKVQAPTGARRRKFTWARHLRLVGMYRVFGHMFFEQNWTETAGGDGLRWSLDMVQERMPQTVAGLKLNTNGTLNAVAQGSIVGKDTILLTTADHRLVHYVREREGSNYFGQSLIRPCYAPWLIKTQVMRVWPTSNRRNGMGIWQVTAPPDAQPQQILEAQRLASSTRASEGAGLGLPAGFTAELKGMTGTLPDHAELANFCNQEMARNTLTMLLTMAGAERGNRSLGETVMDLLIMAQQDDAEFIAGEATDQLVIPLVDANWGESEPAPRIDVGQVGADVETTAQDIYWLTAYAGLKPDRPAREWIRQQRGMPPEDPKDPIYALPAPDAPTPTAPPTTGGSNG
jgi:hypothetical protein